jgi:hypothetical protein
MAGKDDHSKLFARAAEIASNVPEPMQDAAFHRALDLLLGEEGGDRTGGSASRQGRQSKPKPKTGQRGKAKAPSDQGEQEDRASTLIANLDRTAYPHVTDASNVKDRALWLLQIANDDFSIDGLSAPEIAKVLTEKFRLTTTHQAVRQSLERANRLVDRDSRGPVTRYRIMDPGEKYLRNPDSQDKKPTRQKKKSTRSRKAQTAKPARSKAAKASSRKPPATKRRPTPFALLEGLVDSGFFKSPQTIAMIREHMEHKQGRKYKANELSPALLRLLRNGRLSRDKNDNKQYEYSSD